MGRCPACAGPLENADGLLFCAACKTALHSRLRLAEATGVLPEDEALLAELERPPTAIAPCPACDAGELFGGRLTTERVAQCGACRAVWVGGAALGRIKASLARRRAAAAAQRADASHTVDSFGETVATVAGGADPLRFDYDTYAVNIAAVPAALAFGVLAFFCGAEIFVHATTGMWAHETGHAIVAWLGGFFAIPLPFVTIAPSEDRSTLWALVVTSAIGGLGYFAYRKRLWPLLGTAVGLGLLQITLTLGLNPGQATRWVIFGGLAGELVLPALLMAAFYVRLPGRWDFWRYPVLVASAVTLVRGLFLWTRVAAGTREMPHGSMVGSDSEGDIERLVGFYKLAETDLKHQYVTIAWSALAFVACVYALKLRSTQRQAVMRDALPGPPLA